MNRENNLCCRKWQKFAIAIIVLLLARNICAEIIGMPDEGWSIDLPEGFTLADRAGRDRFRFTHTLFNADLLIAQYQQSMFNSAESALKHVQSQFTSTTDKASFIWRNREAAIGRIDPGTSAGWILVLELPEHRGWLSFAAISPPDEYERCEFLLISALDTVCTDDGSWFSSGPMTSFASPSEGSLEARFEALGLHLNVLFDLIDQDAAQSVVDREFSLLTTYLNTPLVIDAWKRYYQIIWKDSWERFERTAFVLSARLPKSSEEKTAELLAWVQDFQYERNQAESDFLALPATFIDKRGDCDSRALLMVLLLNQMGIDAILMISPEFSHALVGSDCPGEGARFESGGKKYLVSDTTAKVAAGMVPSDMADPTKWFAVHFSAFPPNTSTK